MQFTDVIRILRALEKSPIKVSALLPDKPGWTDAVVAFGEGQGEFYAATQAFNGFLDLLDSGWVAEEGEDLILTDKGRALLAKRR